MRYLHSTPPFVALPDSREGRGRPPAAPLLAAAVHAQSEGVLIAGRRWTRNGLKIIFANDSFCAMTGYPLAELQERGQGFLHEDKRDLVELHRWQKRLAPGSTLSGDGWLVQKNGARVYSSWSYCPVSDEEGRVTHIVASYRDLTEKRRLQDALIHAQRLDAVGRLAGGIAHDFNNLLSVIHGYCEIMAERRSVRRLVSRELEEIHLASQQAAHLVRQLLAFSRQQTVNPRVVNLDQLLRSNTEILSRLLKPARSIAFALGAGLTANVRIDPAQLQQVLLNLTLNARDALPAGGRVTIGSSVHRVKKSIAASPSDIPPGEYALLSVSDNGAGMDEGTRAHLFEPFFTTKEPGRGTGLGLSLVFGVVQQSNGYIRVHSAPNVGSTFEIFLPVVDEVAQPVSPPLPSLPGTAGREHVLVVEEDDVLRKMVAGIFTADGYRVLAARTSEEALDRVQQDSVDLLIAQIGGPDKGCEHLTRALHAINPSIKVLAMAQVDPADLTFLNRERYACLPKPFTLSALMKSARRLLDARAA